MKIKLNISFGTANAGDIVDAAVSPGGASAFFYDSQSYSWSISSANFEIVKEQELTGSGKSQGLKDIFGQELKSMSVEFK